MLRCTFQSGEKRKGYRRPVPRQLPWAAVSSVLSFLPSSQDEANYLSCSFPVAQAWGFHPAPDPGCGAHALRKISPNPTKYTEELLPDPNNPIELKRRSAWTGGGPLPSLSKDAGRGTKDQGSASQSGFPFSPPLWASVWRSISALPPPGQSW